MKRLPFIVLLAVCCLPLVSAQVSASYFDGMEAYRKSDYQTALREFKAAGEDVKALYMIGILHEKGEGTNINYTEAAIWYRQAAEKGNPAAQYRLGRLYERGFGVEQNIEEAIKLYRKAAKQGQVDARQALKRVEAK